MAQQQLRRLDAFLDPSGNLCLINGTREGRQVCNLALEGANPEDKASVARRLMFLWNLHQDEDLGGLKRLYRKEKAKNGVPFIEPQDRQGLLLDFLTQGYIKTIRLIRGKYNLHLLDAQSVLEDVLSRLPTHVRFRRRVADLIEHGSKARAIEYYQKETGCCWDEAEHQVEIVSKALAPKIVKDLKPRRTG